MQVLDEDQRRACGSAATLLLKAFVWKDSLEGGKFWAYVHSRLAKMEMTGDVLRVGGATAEQPQHQPKKSPTDEDARRRPRVRFRDHESDAPKSGVLAAVKPWSAGDPCRFLDTDGVAWRFCELEDEDAQ